MVYNELRKDYLLDRWVVIATERGRRPTDFAKKRSSQATTNACPLCVGNENMTPPAVLLYLKSDDGITKDRDRDDARRKDWLIRCVPNLYPAFSPPKIQDEQISTIQSTTSFGYAVGHHEVLVESPNHNEHPADAELHQLTHVVNAYVDRLRKLSSKPYVRYVSIFRNHGPEAGASLSHAHSQIIATPFVPTTIEKEIMTSRNYWSEHGKCILCDIMQREITGPRLILDNDYFGVFTPYASVHPMEFWILPKRHNANMMDMRDDEKVAFASTLKASLRALKDVVNDPPYNFGFHLSLSREDKDCYHWHLEVYPQLAIWAGFERSTGLYINTVQPETAAEALRKAVAP